MTLAFNTTLYVGNRELMVSVEATYQVTRDPYSRADADGNRYEEGFDAVVTSFHVFDQMGRHLTPGIVEDEDLKRQMDEILESRGYEAIEIYKERRR